MKRLALTIAILAVILAPVSMFAADGAAVYKAKCATCHGANGAGDTTMGKNLKLRALGSADVQKTSDADLTKVIADGKGKMPGYKSKLSGDEIKALVTFIRSLK